MIFINNKIVKLFEITVLSIFVIGTSFCMDDGYFNQVSWLASNNNPEPEDVLLRRLGLTKGQIRGLNQSDYEIAYQQHIFLEKVKTLDIKKIKPALEDFCEIWQDRSIHYLSKALDFVIAERDCILQNTDIFVEGSLENHMLSNLDNIYELLTQHGASFKETRSQSKTKFGLFNSQPLYLWEFNIEFDNYLNDFLNVYREHGLTGKGFLNYFCYKNNLKEDKLQNLWNIFNYIPESQTPNPSKSINCYFCHSLNILFSFK